MSGTTPSESWKAFSPCMSKAGVLGASRQLASGMETLLAQSLTCSGEGWPDMLSTEDGVHPWLYRAYTLVMLSKGGKFIFHQ